MVSSTFCGQLAESIAYSDRTKSFIWLFFSARGFAQKKYDPSSEGTFPSRITFTRFFKALKKFSPVRLLNLAVPCGRKTPRLNTIDISGVRNRASFPLRKFQLECSVIVDRVVCNLVVAYCSSDSGLNITVVYFSANRTQSPI